MSIHRKLVTWSFVILALSFISIPAFADETEVAAVYESIDKAFSDKSTEAISAILQKNASSSSYNLYESYTLKKTRQLIISGDLEFAREASLAVIDNNLENFDAVDLYSYIDKAILNKQAQQQAEANRQKLENERIAAQNERTKQRLKNSYEEISTTSGQNVYTSEAQASYSSINWNVDIGIVDIMFQKITKPDYTSIKYGIALGADLFYNTEQFDLGVDLSADMLMLTLAKGEQEMLTSFKAVPEISFAAINKNLFLRAGFAVYGRIQSAGIDTGSQKTFVTPALGLGFENVKFGDNTFAIHADYYLGSYAYDNLKAAFEGGASILVPLVVSERSTIGVRLGVSDMCFIKKEGIENRAKAIFAIGVGNVNK